MTWQVVGICGMVGIVAASTFLFFHNDEGAAKKETCSWQEEQRTVAGSSLEPIVKNGQEIVLLEGYYNCHAVEREDIVVYEFAEGRTPLLKIIKGVPGNTFSLQPVSGGSGWNIIINGEVVRNSQKIAYVLDSNEYRMLHLYERDYSGLIPPDAYLILGNLPQGSRDSTQIGLVGKDGILGKAVAKTAPQED